MEELFLDSPCSLCFLNLAKERLTFRAQKKEMIQGLAHRAACAQKVDSRADRRGHRCDRVRAAEGAARL